MREEPAGMTWELNDPLSISGGLGDLIVTVPARIGGIILDSLHRPIPIGLLSINGPKWRDDRLWIESYAFPCSGA